MKKPGRCTSVWPATIRKQKRAVKDQFRCLVVVENGKGAEAAARYEQYINKYPNGERLDTAHLNIIDGYREARRSTGCNSLDRSHATKICRHTD